MSCSGKNCGCGSGCNCGGSRCTGGNMYPDLNEKSTTTATPIMMGIASEKKSCDGFDQMVAGFQEGCKCGSNCTCNPCNC